MKKNKRFVASLMLWLLIIAGLFGCGSAMSDAKDEFDEQLAKQTEKAQELADEIQDSLLTPEATTEPTATATPTPTATPEPWLRRTPEGSTRSPFCRRRWQLQS